MQIRTAFCHTASASPRQMPTARKTTATKSSKSAIQFSRKNFIPLPLSRSRRFRNPQANPRRNHSSSILHQDFPFVISRFLSKQNLHPSQSASPTAPPQGEPRGKRTRNRRSSCLPLEGEVARRSRDGEGPHAKAKAPTPPKNSPLHFPSLRVYLNHKKKTWKGVKT